MTDQPKRPEIPMVAGPLAREMALKAQAEDAEALLAHGDHDQDSHGNWANGTGTDYDDSYEESQWYDASREAYDDDYEHTYLTARDRMQRNIQIAKQGRSEGWLTRDEYNYRIKYIEDRFRRDSEQDRLDAEEYEANRPPTWDESVARGIERAGGAVVRGLDALTRKIEQKAAKKAAGEQSLADRLGAHHDRKLRDRLEGEGSKAYDRVVKSYEADGISAAERKKRLAGARLVEKTWVTQIQDSEGDVIGPDYGNADDARIVLEAIKKRNSK